MHHDLLPDACHLQEQHDGGWPRPSGRGLLHGLPPSTPRCPLHPALCTRRTPLPSSPPPPRLRYDALCPSMVSRGEWGAGDDRRMLRSMLSGGASREWEVDWDSLVQGRSAIQVCAQGRGGACACACGWMGGWGPAATRRGQRWSAGCASPPHPPPRTHIRTCAHTTLSRCPCAVRVHCLPPAHTPAYLSPQALRRPTPAPARPTAMSAPCPPVAARACAPAHPRNLPTGPAADPPPPPCSASGAGG